jgi:hypothetical protein
VRRGGRGWRHQQEKEQEKEQEEEQEKEQEEEQEKEQEEEQEKGWMWVGTEQGRAPVACPGRSGLP